MPKRAPQHKPRRARLPDRRPSAAARGYDSAWRELRAAFLLANPLCVAMLRDGRRCGRPATQVDHKKTLASGGDKFDEANLQALCASCHSRKGCALDGLLGRPKISHCQDGK